MGIGDNIKKLRVENQLTQVDFAKIAGVSDKAVSAWENGTKIPRMGTIEKISQYFGVPISSVVEADPSSAEHNAGVKIPVLGVVRAGYPIYAEQNILDYEEISTKMAATGEFFALQIKGDSMEPRMFHGDIVIVRKQEYIENGEIAVVLVNGDSATVKKIVKKDTGIMLVPLNSSCSYEPTFYTPQDIENLPVKILGKVVEVRGRV